MTDDPLYTQLAGLLNDAYVNTQTMRQEYLAEHGRLPNRATTCHHRLNLIQDAVEDSPGLSLGSAYRQANRIEVREEETGRRLVFRSASTVKIESSLRLFDDDLLLAEPSASPLFDDEEPDLLIYEYGAEGVELHLSVAGRVDGHGRLYPIGEPSYLGFWPFISTEPEPFDQGTDTGFDELDLDLGEDAEGGA